VKLNCQVLVAQGGQTTSLCGRRLSLHARYPGPLRSSASSVGAEHKQTALSAVDSQRGTTGKLRAVRLPPMNQNEPFALTHLRLGAESANGGALSLNY
jgi:hypothetical protein